MQSLDLWVGVEATVSRIQDRVQDQLRLSGFHARLDDIDRLASLGATHIRFPLLWERTAPNSLKRADWAWADSRLERLSSYDLKPIIGLVHHGSRPKSTNLVQSSFVTRLVKYARAVAQRYPH